MAATDPRSAELSNADSAVGRLRAEVRDFVDDYDFEPSCDAWMRMPDPEFSRELGRQGWIGMTLPREYGGGQRSYVERLAVTEELLKAGAPVAAHWIADRQMAPTFLKYGTERLKQETLPGICRGELYVCAGMSEPDSGSDVASVRTRARRTESGWVISGRKVWTTLAHMSHFIYVLARTEDDPEDRHAGLSEFVVPADAPGVTIVPLPDVTGDGHFNEVVLDDVEVPDWRLLGEPGNAWYQIVRQLDYERSGPERFLSTFPAFDALARIDDPAQSAAAALGPLAAEYSVLRMMSKATAVGTDEGTPPGAIASMVKDMGTNLEQRIANVAMDLLDAEVPGLASEQGADDPSKLFAQSVVYSPAFTIRGGTSEIMRTIVARRYVGTGSKPGKDSRDEGSSRLLAAGPELGMLAEAASGVLESAGEPADILAGGAPLGWFSSFVPVELGGQGDGPTFRYLATILKAQGRAGIDAPIAEQAVGSYLLAAGGETALAGDAMEGRLRVAVLPPRESRSGFSSRRRMSTAGLADADVVVGVDAEGTAVMLDPDDVSYRTTANLAGDPRQIADPGADIKATLGQEADLMLELLAMCRAAQVVGALEEIGRVSSEYAATRVQFGRPIARFQAVSHMLVTMAEEQVAAQLALDRLSGLDFGEPWALGAAAVKHWTGRAARTAYRVAHQVHGAIGITAEYPLHRHTLRALAWSEEYGGSSWWAAGLGGRVMTRGVEEWWDSISEVVDG